MTRQARLSTPIENDADHIADHTDLADAYDESYSVTAYGALGDGATDDSTAFQDAIDAIPATGGTLVIPNTGSDYVLASGLDFSTKHNLQIEGHFGRNRRTDNVAGLAVGLKYTGTTTAPFNFDDCRGLDVNNVRFLYDSGSFTGDLVSVDNSSRQAIENKFSDCYFGADDPTSTMTAANLVTITGSQETMFDNCNFRGAVDCLQGASASATANGVTLLNCTWNNFSNYAISNAGRGWHIGGNVFEPNSSGAAAVLEVESGVQPQGVTFTGCWLGDVTAAGDAIKWRGRGLSILGGKWNHLESNLITPMEKVQGVVVIGAFLQGDNAGPGKVFDFDTNAAANTSTGVYMLGNDYFGYTTTFFINDTKPAHGQWDRFDLTPPAYTRNATVVEDRTLLASASATTLNNNNVLAALISDLQDIGILG